MSDAAPPAKPVRVWDIWTRLFHWSLVPLIAAAWWTAEKRDSFNGIEIHRLIGYAIIGLVVFRLYWGLVGSSTARFAGFLKGPAAGFAYMKSLGGKHAPVLGHNAVGGWSVAAMLALVLAIVTLGLFTVDEDGIDPSPLADKVSFELGRQIVEWHERLFWVLTGFIALHLAAIAFYAVVKRDNLVGPMITGARGDLPQGAVMAPLWRAALGIAIAVAVAWGASKGFKL